MPSQLVKCAFGFKSFNGPKTKCTLYLWSWDQSRRARAPGAPPPVSWALIIINNIRVVNTIPLSLTKTTAAQNDYEVALIVIIECAGYIFWQLFLCTIVLLILLGHLAILIYVFSVNGYIPAGHVQVFGVEFPIQFHYLEFILIDIIMLL